MINNTFQASRTVREELRLPYEPLMRRLMEVSGEGDADVLSDKIAARMCATSERQIRKARQEGMNPYLADYLTVKGLGVHPMDLFGEAWLTAEAMWADDIYNKKMTPEEAEAIEAALLAGDLGEAVA